MIIDLLTNASPHQHLHGSRATCERACFEFVLDISHGLLVSLQLASDVDGQPHS